MLHISHPAQNRQYTGATSRKPKCPRSDTRPNLTLLQPRGYMIGYLRKSSTQQRFHNNSRNIPFLQFSIKIIGIHVSPRSMFPIHVIQLNLHKIPGPGGQEAAQRIMANTSSNTSTVPWNENPKLRIRPASRSFIRKSIIPFSM